MKIANLVEEVLIDYDFLEHNIFAKKKWVSCRIDLVLITSRRNKIQTVSYSLRFSHISLNCSCGLCREMALGGTAPPRGSAAATASLRRRRTSSAGASGGAAGTMLQFYTDDAPGLKISPNVVLIMSIGFIAFVAVLHVMGKLYFARR